MTDVSPADIEVRRAEEADLAAVLDLMRSSLDWRPEDPNEEFFDWKHHQNPFGRSPAWVALHDGRIVGFRTFLRWMFVDDEQREIRAVRAVDTATAPEFRGLGIFRRLTLRAVAEFTESGVGFVFNTPNEFSRPGYLSMGWAVSRRLPVGVRLAGLPSVGRMVRARTPASLWSEASDVGLPAARALEDDPLVSALLEHAPAHGVRTLRTSAYLRWRTGFPALHYRVLLASDGNPQAGGLVFRLRRRGPAVEAAVVELLVPDRRAGASLMRRLLRETAADYAIGTMTGATGLLVPLPGQGPLLTTRPLATAAPSPKAWRLTLGDIELF